MAPIEDNIAYVIQILSQSQYLLMAILPGSDNVFSFTSVDFFQLGNFGVIWMLFPDLKRFDLAKMKLPSAFLIKSTSCRVKEFSGDRCMKMR